MFTFLIIPWITGVALSLLTGPLGCFVVWNRIAYFGDLFSHAALLGIVMAVAMGISPLIGMIFIAFLLSKSFAAAERWFQVPTDAALSILGQGSLGLALILLHALSLRFDLSNYLFGDLLTVQLTDLYRLLAVIALFGVILYKYWRSFLLVTIHQELAAVEGLPVQQIRALLLALIAATILLCIRVTGGLLVTALLVMPAVSARAFSDTPAKMLLFSTCCSILAVTLGIGLACFLDTAVGPAIVVMALLIAMLSRGWRIGCLR